MRKEIERKFLVSNHAYRLLDKGKLYRQGFLSVEPERVIRIRAVEKSYADHQGNGERDHP